MQAELRALLLAVSSSVAPHAVAPHAPHAVTPHAGTDICTSICDSDVAATAAAAAAATESEPIATTHVHAALVAATDSFTSICDSDVAATAAAAAADSEPIATTHLLGRQHLLDGLRLRRVCNLRRHLL